jgi:hypothetical protein
VAAKEFLIRRAGHVIVPESEADVITVVRHDLPIMGSSNIFGAKKVSVREL